MRITRHAFCVVCFVDFGLKEFEFGCVEFSKEFSRKKYFFANPKIKLLNLSHEPLRL